MIQHSGVAVSPGIARGKAYVYKKHTSTAEHITIGAADVAAQIALYEQASQKAREELQAMEGGTQEQEEILRTHISFLMDEDMIEEIRTEITQNHKCAQWAVETVYGQVIDMLDASPDPVFKERIADFADVRDQLLKELRGERSTGLEALSEPVILVAKELLPSDTISMDPAKILGIVTERGGVTAHMAVIARSLAIPAVAGISGVDEAITSGTELIVDGQTGTVYSQPDPAILEEYRKKAQAFDRQRQIEKEYLPKPACTADGVRIETKVNLGSADEWELAAAACSDGVGLFRSEFLYMNNDHLPTEEEQFTAYKAALEALAPRPVTLRTMDIGADKQLPYLPLPHEENPALGMRALRLCFAKPDVFRTQLRAACRAAVYGNLQVMFPMVSSVTDVIRAKQLLAEVAKELADEGIPFRADFPVGVMVEVPSLALMASQIAKQAAFASIGTNDLVQYLLAADRDNPDMAAYYQSFHPAVFQAIRMIIEGFSAQGKPVSVCGELGSDPRSVPILLGLGLRTLSISPARLGEIKYRIAGMTMAQMEQMAQDILAMGSQEEVVAYLEKQPHQAECKEQTAGRCDNV